MNVENSARGAGHWQQLERLILVAGHAVYIGTESRTASGDKAWVLRDFQKGEPPRYIAQIRFGVELAAADSKALLVFSGGQTRLDARSRSEGQSYWLVAEQFGWWQKAGVRERATAEEYARDSFENLLFGIARFREYIGQYPGFIEVVGWEFKRKRFDFHRQTIGWPGDDQHYQYHGVSNPNDLDSSMKSEAKMLAAFIQDPFGTEEPLRSKRERRNPFNQSPPYAATCPEIAGLLNHKTTEGVSPRGILPWHIHATENRRST
ncbi:MAG: hypothetical protein ABSD29_11195 [Verrucomicrobiota bacterium]|jgi:hypothetical protein